MASINTTSINTTNANMKDIYIRQVSQITDDIGSRDYNTPIITGKKACYIWFENALATFTKSIPDNDNDDDNDNDNDDDAYDILTELFMINEEETKLVKGIIGNYYDVHVQIYKGHKCGESRYINNVDPVFCRTYLINKII